ncbi:yersiniabactin siderophore biosynthetic protein [Xenorhabdus beddingii]|uniref:Yersiniabactin siderophore biosynthetic protein n=1 Tax=Xenorhabdus beddingii TaxID=40578 RepID=A0A1Y2SSD5_9GAMM|nr:AMP-binding protein [Xenorhabdus beddingii]OTA20791.1 yersiniabactin siderophore biosynthetic protein [Xenorhabdus beddingii]
MDDFSICLNQQLANALQTGGSAPALVSAGEVISYQQLMSLVFSTAARLRAIQIKKGDRIAFQLPNCAEGVVLMLATLITGAVPVPILPAYRERELRHILKKTRPTIVAVTKGNQRFSALRVVDDLLREENLPATFRLVDDTSETPSSDWNNLREFCSSNASIVHLDDHSVTEMYAEDTAMMLLSSGTTGLPKPIARLNGGYSYMITEGCKVFELSRDSVYLAVLPISHGFVINCPGILGTLSSGGCVVLAQDTSAQTALKLVVNYGITHTTLVPALLNQWLERIDDLQIETNTLRLIQVGGARLSTDLAKRAESRLGMHIQQCYGMSEGLLCFTHSTDNAEIRHNSQGRPLSNRDEVLIVDEIGTPLPCGRSGELVTRGPYTITTYFNDPEASAWSFTPAGYYRTGDLAHLDTAGNVYIDGRVRDAINRGGEKFSPEEIEELSKGHSVVKDAACIGIPDNRFGEVACLFLALTEGEQISLPAIRQYLEKAGVAQFKLPEKLLFINEIPRKGIGKVDRVLLRTKAYNAILSTESGKQVGQV